MEFVKLAAQYQEALFRRILPFWITNSRDTLCGGYFNALTEQGDFFDTDKVISLQAQQVWAFCWLYNHVDALPKWLEHAQHGAEFLLNHGRGADGRWLSVVDRRGRPVSPAESVVPDCFAAMAFAQLGAATGEETFGCVAQETLQQVLNYRQQQRTDWEEQLGSFRQFKHLSEPMMILKALVETRSLLEPEFYKEATETIIGEIQNHFFDKRINILRENVLSEGAFSDSTLGRRLHPGLAFETTGYLLEAATLSGNRRLAQQAVLMAIHLAEAGWDNPTGGFLQYIDLKERPSVFSEWDRKVWWVHSEAMSVFARGYLQTRHPDALKWFQRAHEYAWQYFPDAANQEWFGVLDRKGQPVTRCKATPEKGCYHLVKNLHDCWRALEKCAQLRTTFF